MSTGLIEIVHIASAWEFLVRQHSRRLNLCSNEKVKFHSCCNLSDVRPYPDMLPVFDAPRFTSSPGFNHRVVLSD